MSRPTGARGLKSVQLSNLSEQLGRSRPTGARGLKSVRFEDGELMSCGRVPQGRVD